MRLDGFGLFVDDMPTMVRFYRDVLGFEIKEGEDAINVYLIKDGTLFMLYERKNFEKMTSRKYEYLKGLNGHFEIALYVDTFEEVDAQYENAIANLTYQTVIWKGFDHEGDQAELEKMLANKVLPPNRRSELCLAVVDETGEFAAHCTCWYDERTDYTYVEPVCTIPKYRGMGLGKAVVLEALRRCKALGAKQAFVISDQEFYKKLGFARHSKYIFFKKS